MVNVLGSGYFQPCFWVVTHLFWTNYLFFIQRSAGGAIYLFLYTAIRPRGHSRQVCAKSVSIRQVKGWNLRRMQG